MSRELQCLIHWPDREVIRQTLPKCFKPRFSRSVCIIDCSEIVIQRPTSKHIPHIKDTIQLSFSWQSTQRELLFSCQNVGVVEFQISTLQVNVDFIENFFQVTWCFQIGDLILQMNLHYMVHLLQFHHLQKARINCPRQKLKPQDSYHEYASMWNVPLGG